MKIVAPNTLDYYVNDEINMSESFKFTAGVESCLPLHYDITSDPVQYSTVLPTMFLTHSLDTFH